eukprot:TRINITY_DN4983_c0_g1_i3.p1 TRINITY_DN4983_c0_g1~~TRINITY_DN4983_c0_g1_i3.p1  ORF type:complete len:153 (-),score=21.06 TRINITY_DN4983_c0_g1_i3:77-535(-)
MASSSNPGGGYRRGAGAQEENLHRRTNLWFALYSFPRGEVVLAQNIAKKIKLKIKAILDIAQDNGHDIVILSAFGCGAYGNPPAHTARLFREVISTHFLGVFEQIMFSIFEDHNSYQQHNIHGNVASFAKIFKCDNVHTFPEDFEEDEAEGK